MSGSDDKTKYQDIKVYQDKKAKAEDFKSSAYTLLLVGVNRDGRIGFDDRRSTAVSLWR